MKIIGFQSGHDVSYCVLEDGVPTIHNEWERFLRKKEPSGDGLKFLFEQEENTGALEGVQYFTHGNPNTRYGIWAHRNNPETGEYPAFNFETDKKMYATGAAYTEFSHHLSHAANAFFSSNFKEALIVTIDGGGNELKRDYTELGLQFNIPTALTYCLGKDTKLNPLCVVPAETFNLGMLWHTITKDVLGLSWGYPAGCAAGTLMAMAAVGHPDENLFPIIKALTNGHIKNESAIQQLKDYVSKKEGNDFNLTASLQFMTEEVFKGLIDGAITEAEKQEDCNKVEYLCLAGGVALNSVAVGKIYDWFPQIKDIYVPPVPYDAGLAIGSAQYLYHHILNNPRVVWDDNASPYLGKTYSKEEVMAAIKDAGVISSAVTDDDVIKLICENDNVISVFGGGSESGRRALGNRSIIADPRSETMKAVINDKVKHRQSFRPFAPSILREEVKNWFVRDVNSPYMSCVINIKEEKADQIPAVCHVDNSARLQTVTEKDNKWYYNFIKKFGEKTGVPILLNTSFNDREPIVEKPEDAIACFQKTNIDYLYFFDFGILVKKA